MNMKVKESVVFELSFPIPYMKIFQIPVAF